MAYGRWLTPLKAVASPQVTLLCLHYAGGNAGVFRQWPHRIRSNTDVLAVELPGHNTRFTEPLINSLEVLVESLVAAILNERRSMINGPYVLFGHSMGGLIAFELARRLQYLHGAPPIHLVVSGSRAPGLPRIDPPRHALPRDAFIAELKKIDGTPPAVMEDEELLDVVLPLLRSDFAVVENYSCRPHARIACPITALGGTEDQSIELDLLSAWGDHTSKGGEVVHFTGGHFFLHDKEADVIAVVNAVLDRVIGGLSAGATSFEPAKLNGSDFREPSQIKILNDSGQTLV